MHRRILLALLGFKMGLPYEREALRAVRRYLWSLLFPFLFSLSWWILLSSAVLSLFAFVAPELFWNLVSTGAFLGIFAFVIYTLWLFALSPSHFLAESTAREAAGITKHEQLTYYARAIADRVNAPTVVVYEFKGTCYHSCLVGHNEETWKILVSNETGRDVDPLGIIGIIAHELAHAVLPLGLRCFFLCTIKLAWIDRMLLWIDRIYWSDLADEIRRSVGSRGETTPLLRPLRGSACAILFRILFLMSSYRISVIREHAVDAIAVLMLGHTYPLHELFVRLEKEDGAMSGRFLGTHPLVRARINALRKMDESEYGTR